MLASVIINKNKQNISLDKLVLTDCQIWFQKKIIEIQRHYKIIKPY